MGVKINTISPYITDSTKQTIYATLEDLKRKSHGNSLFTDLKLTVFSNWKESKISPYCDFPSTKQGFTSYPIFMEGNNIALQTNELQSTGDDRKIVPADQGQIKENMLHEIGHLFDFHFATPDEEVVQKIKDTMNVEEKPTEEDYAEFDALLAEYKKNNGLSDSEEFKQAWKKDVEKAFKGYFLFENREKSRKLGYFSPTADYDGNDSGKKIELFDGIDDRELELADRAREEVFAQLVAYGLGADGKNYNKELILETYKESYEVVKKYIEEKLSITVEEK